MLHVDFETHAPKGIKGLTTSEYVRQVKAFGHLWCFAYALDDDGKVQLWTPRLPVPELFHSYDGLYAAWNAPFEHKVWNTVLVDYGFPAVPLSRWRCIQAAAREMRLPAKLAKVSAALDLGAEKSASTFMQRLGQDQVKNPWCPSEWIGLYVYCKQDVEVERAAAAKIGTPMDQRAWEYTELLNARGLPIDRSLVEGACYVWDEYRRSINAKYKALTGLRVKQREKGLQWLKENVGLPINDMRRETLLPYREYEPVRYLTEAAATAPDKFDALRRNLSDRDRIHDCLIYHGAGTGRYTGSVFQPQNLSRGILKLDQIIAMRERVRARDVSVMDEHDEPSRALGSLIRSCIAAPNLICSDFSQIEARGVAWISGCDSLLHDFSSGADPYVSMARRIFKDDSITKDDSEKRFVGKSAVLGCMYGLGAAGFKEYCARQGKDLDDKLCQQAVDIYRSANPEIPKFWAGVEHAFFTAIQRKKTTSYRGIEFSWQSDKWATIKLPSGRLLSYFRPVAGYNKSGKVFKYTGFNSAGDPWDVHLWGGIITENCLTSETPVLTNRGWVRLDSVLDDDLIYDGESFVEHGGLVYKGEQQVIDVDGVLATPDHLFLNEDGEWQNGLEINRPYRPDLRAYGNPILEPFWKRSVLPLQPTFDIVNCGPNHRFVVMGRSGPMIAHNCVQAFCRDIMQESMYGLEDIGYNCVLTVHDEVLVEGKPGQTLSTMNEVMTRRPDWCPDLPIASEGWTGEFYRK